MIMAPPDRSPPDETQGLDATLDHGALAALVREVSATHFLVWSTNAGGVLTSAKIPVSDAAQQARMAGRIVESNFDEAMKMLRAASAQFDNAARRWEAQARQSEEKLRADRAARRLNEAKARHNAVRTRIVPVQSLFRRAIQSLSDLDVRKRLQADEAPQGDPAANGESG
jgi:hypothetical protein